jgi:hypothetical protein
MMQRIATAKELEKKRRETTIIKKSISLVSKSKENMSDVKRKH